MMNTCPCCSNPLLRYARSNGVYWFCPHCWQEMPDIESLILTRQQRIQQLEQLVGSLDPLTQ